ncbi:MAG: helix-turn-helix domain-containing protein [bacterium]
MQDKKTIQRKEKVPFDYTVEEDFYFELNFPYYSNNPVVENNAHSLPAYNGVEFGIVTSGDGKISANGLEYNLKKYDVFFLDSGIPHWYLSNDQSMQIIWVVLPYSTLKLLSYGRADFKLFEPFIMVRIGLNPVIPNRKDMLADAENICSLYKAKIENWDLLALLYITKFIVEIARWYFFDRTKFTSESLIIRQLFIAVYYLNRNYRNDIEMIELAELSELSEARFLRLFKEIMGMSPLKYRDDLRIKDAISLMISTDKSLEVISILCGYKNYKQFNTVFKRQKNLSPKEFMTNVIKRTGGIE